MSSYFGCNSCKATFPDAAGHKTHYDTEWHRYNLRRRVSELDFVTEEEFNRRRQLSLIVSEGSKDKFVRRCDVCSMNAERSHMQSKKHRGNQKQFEKRQQPEEDSLLTEVAEVPESTESGAAEENVEDLPFDKDRALNEKTTVYREYYSFELTECLFCFSKNFHHMLLAHGFFIPNSMYLKDVEGLMKYIGEKIGFGKECLTCQSTRSAFGSVPALQSHMIDKGHCFIKNDNVFASATDSHEQDDDLNEYDSFYDYTIGSEPVVDHNGELRLPNGTLLGSRQLRHYYRQHFTSLDSRPSVVANRLALEYRAQNIPASTLINVDEKIRSIVSRAKQTSYTDRTRYEERRLEYGIRENALLKKYYRCQTG